MVSAGVSTWTVVVQRGSVPPGGQLLPGASDAQVLVMMPLPGSGFFTVMVPVTVTTPPTGMSPLQYAPVAVMTNAPEVTVWSPLGLALATRSAPPTMLTTAPV